MTYSLHAMRLEWPTRWDSLFERAAPLVLEIGFGHADFLVDFATRHPEVNVIGIEYAHSPMSWAEKKLKRNPLPNVRLVFGEALMSLHCLFEPEAISQVHLNFSDPWPKRRHLQRRLIDTGLLAVLVSRLTPDGELYIATDITDYAEQIYEALNAIAGIQNLYDPIGWHDERDNADLVTHYEQKAIEAGRARYYFKWRRTGEPVSHPPRLGVEPEMANIVLYLPLSLAEIAEKFETNLVQKHRERVVRFHSLYQQRDYPKLAIDTYIEEPLFNQRLMIGIRERDPHHYVVSFEPIGFPRVTPGVHDAVYYTAEKLVAMHTDGKILDAKVQKPK